MRSVGAKLVAVASGATKVAALDLEAELLREVVAVADCVAWVDAVHSAAECFAVVDCEAGAGSAAGFL